MRRLDDSDAQRTAERSDICHIVEAAVIAQCIVERDILPLRRQPPFSDGLLVEAELVEKRVVAQALANRICHDAQPFPLEAADTLSPR